MYDMILLGSSSLTRMLESAKICSVGELIIHVSTITYTHSNVYTYNGYSNGSKLLILFSASTYVIAFMIEFFPLPLVDQSRSVGVTP